MTAHFYDGTRLVTDFLMYWIDMSSDKTLGKWSIFDNEGGEEFFQGKLEAENALRRYYDQELEG